MSALRWGGVLIAVAFSLPFFVDAGTFALAAVLIFGMRGSFEPTGLVERRSFKDELKEGVTWLWNHRLLRSMAVILGIMNGLFMVSLSTYVLFVQEILHLDASSFGLLLTSGAVGGVIGSISASKVSQKIGPGASLFTTLLVSALAILITGLTTSAIVVWLMFAITSYVAVRRILDDTAGGWRDLVSSKRTELTRRRDRLDLMIGMLDEIAECECTAVASCPCVSV